MKKIVLLLLILKIIINNGFSQWETVGIEGFTAGSADMVCFDATGSEVLYVAFADGANSNKVTVMKYNGISWTIVGTAGISAGTVSSLSLAINSTGIPYIAYSDAINSDKPTVKMFNGSAWVNVGTSGFTAGSTNPIKIKIVGTEPHVAFSDGTYSGKATVMKFNGTDWVNVGIPGFTPGIASEITLEKNGGNVIHVAYRDIFNLNKTSVMKFNGTDWENIGTAGFTTGAINSPSLTFANGITPYIAFKDGNALSKASVMKFNGTSWINEGIPGFSQGTIAYPSLVLNSSTPYIAYQDVSNNAKATVKQYNGSFWTTIDTSGFSAGMASYVTLKIVNNNLYVAYKDGQNSNKASVKKFTSCSFPTISQHPSSSSVCHNITTSFSVAASGSTLSYQWQRNEGSGWVDLTNTVPFSNVTTPTMNISNADYNMNNDQYRCIVNKYCMPTMPTIASNAATLTVNVAPSIVSHPENVSVCVGGNTSMQTFASGTSLTYQWQTYDGSGWINLTNSSNYSNVTTSILGINNVTLAMNNYVYRCQVSGVCTPNVSTNQANLTVNTLPAITQHPLNLTICEGTNSANFITASGTSISYQWQKNEGSGWVDLTNTIPFSNVNSSQITITNIQNEMDGLFLRCVVSGACTPSAVSDSVLLTVNTSPVFTSLPIDSIICESENVSFSAAANGTNLYFGWQINDGSGWESLTNTFPYSNVNTPVMSITQAGNSFNNLRFRCLVAGTCSPLITSNEVVLTIKPLPNTSILVNSNMLDTLNTIYIQGCGGTNQIISINNFISNYSYNWYKIIAPDTILNGTGSTQNFNLSNTNEVQGVYYLITTHANGCNIKSKNIIVTSLKNPANNIVSVSMPTYICKGDTMLLTASNTENQNYLYKWFNNTTELSTNDSLVLLNYTAVVPLNIQAIHDTVIYDFELSCPGNLQNINTTIPDNVNPPSVITDNLYCKYSTVNLTPSNNPPLNTVMWYENSLLINNGPYFTIPSLTNSHVFALNNVNEHNCVSLDTVIKITVDSIKAEFSVSDSIIELNNVVNFTNQSTNGNTYHWNFGDGQTSTSINPAHYYYSINTFTVSLTATSPIGCKDTIIKQNLIQVTGIEDNLYMENIFIYPNPVNEILSIENKNANKKEIEISVYDILGNTLLTEKTKNNKISINMYNYPSGIYILKLNNKKIKIQKL